MPVRSVRNVGHDGRVGSMNAHLVAAIGEADLSRVHGEKLDRVGGQWGLGKCGCQLARSRSREIVWRRGHDRVPVWGKGEKTPDANGIGYAIFVGSIGEVQSIQR